SLSSIVATVSYLFITLIYFKVTGTFSLLNLLAAIIFPSFIVYSHRTNIKRLLNGTEYKFGKKKE
ncbi:MAG: acyl-phosphate glycerol 3-phosphate acyltransferase, partial [Oscillospiraceae bacterium]